MYSCKWLMVVLGQSPNEIKKKKKTERSFFLLLQLVRRLLVLSFWTFFYFFIFRGFHNFVPFRVYSRKEPLRVAQNHSSITDQHKDSLRAMELWTRWPLCHFICAHKMRMLQCTRSAGVLMLMWWCIEKIKRVTRSNLSELVPAANNEYQSSFQQNMK